MRALLKPMKDRGFKYPAAADREYFDLDITGDICALRDMVSGRWHGYVRSDYLPSGHAMSIASSEAISCEGASTLPVLFELDKIVPPSLSPLVRESLSGKWARVAKLSEWASAGEAKKKARQLSDVLVYAKALDSFST